MALGATLKQIRDKTGVKIDIPRRDSLGPNLTNGHGNGISPSMSGTASPFIVEEDDEEPTVQITVSGPQLLALEAQALINEIIATKTFKATQRIRDIPASILPFITTRRASFEAAAEGREIQTSLTVATREITVTGDREAVIRVMELIKSTVESLNTSLTSIPLNLPKRQHRLLVGKAAEEIMLQSKCAVVVPKAEEPSDDVLVWGRPDDLSNGLAAVIAKSNSAYIHEFPLPGPISTSKQILTYMLRVNFVRTLTAAHPDLAVYTADPSVWEKSSSLSIELVGEKAIVDDGIRQISELLGKLIGALKEVPIDWLVHRIVAQKNAKRQL
jgi:hypothetical protein